MHQHLWQVKEIMLCRDDVPLAPLVRAVATCHNIHSLLHPSCTDAILRRRKAVAGYVLAAAEYKCTHVIYVSSFVSSSPSSTSTAVMGMTDERGATSSQRATCACPSYRAHLFHGGQLQPATRGRIHPQESRCLGVHKFGCALEFAARHGGLQVVKYLLGQSEQEGGAFWFETARKGHKADE